MWRVTWTGIRSHKRRFAATAVAVLLGVAFLTGALATGDTMTAGFDSLFREANAGTDVVVRSASVIGAGDLRERGTVDATVAEELSALAGVATASVSIDGTAQVVSAGGDPIGGGGPPTLATNWLGDTPTNPWRLTAGHAPRDVTGDRPYEVVIDRATARKGGLAVGETTTVLTPAAVPVTIVGIARFGSADSLGPTTYTAFTAAAATELVGTPGTASEIRLAARTGISQDRLRDRVATALPVGLEAITGDELTAEMLDDIRSDFLTMFEYILVAFAGIAVVVAAFSIHNTFSILTAQRTSESALLRALGASRRQVLAAVIAEAAAVGVAATAAGLVLGYGIARGMTALMSGAGIDVGVDGVVITASTLVTSVAVGVGVTVLASLVPAARASRVAPLEALRTSAVDTSAASVLRITVGAILTTGGAALVITATLGDDTLARAAIGSLVTLIGAVALGPIVAGPATAAFGILPRLLRGHTGELAQRNAARDPRRTASSAAALMIGTAVVALFATVGASIKATITDTVDADFGGDLVVADTNFSGPGIDPAVADDIRALDETSVAAGLGIGALRLDGEATDTSVADPGALGSVLDLGVIDGSLDDVTAGHLAVSEKYAREHGLTIGSAIDAEFVDGASETLTVGAIYTSTINVGDTIITSADWSAHHGNAGLVVVLVDLAPGVGESDGAALVGAITAAHGAPDPQTRSEYVDSIGSEVDQMLVFVYGMLTVAILIALMGIANTLSLAIHERTRELGMLRAIGQTRAQVRSTVRWESVIVAAFGAASGIVLGTFLGWGLLRAIADDLGYGVFALPVTALTLVVVIAAGAGVAAAWRPARRAARIDILTAVTTS